VCVYSTSRLSGIVVLLFWMCVPRRVSLLFAVAVLLFSQAIRTCMASLSSRCNVRDRRSVAGLCGGMAASGACGLSSCVVWESVAHGVVHGR
jgi:hypothetical protein